MNKCYYHHDKKIGKVLIPECLQVIHSNDIEDCTCQDYNNFKYFEKEQFNIEIKKRNDYIKELEKEIERLNKIIKDEKK